MSGADLRVAIVGGGAAGLVLALLLERNGGQVQLVERDAPRSSSSDNNTSKEEHPSAPLRTYALSRRSRNLLRSLGIWDDALDADATQVRQMQVWDGGSGGAIDFAERRAAEGDCLAWIVAAEALSERLWQRVADSSVQVHRPALLQGFSVHGNRVQLRLKSELLEADVAVAADGAHSHLRALAGVATSQRDTGQAVISATVRTQKLHRHTALQVFSRRGGPLALLPLTRGQDEHWRSLIWSLPLQQAQSTIALSDAAFHAFLRRETEGATGMVCASSRRHLLPIVHTRAHTFAASRLVLIGDAAHSMHPLMGQGLNLALADTAVLAQCLASGAQVALSRQLSRYARRRCAERDLMAGAVDGLLWLFTPPSAAEAAPARWLRGLAMRAVAGFPPARTAAAAAASGLYPTRSASL